MILRITPMHDFVLPYPEQYQHSVELDEDDYTAEDLGLAMCDALELAHKHPEGPDWFHHFVVTFEKV